MNYQEWNDRLTTLSPKYARIKRQENRAMICELAEPAREQYGLFPVVDSFHKRTKEHEGLNWEGKFALLIIRLEKAGFDFEVKGSPDAYLAAGIPEKMFPVDDAGISTSRPGTTRLDVRDEVELQHAKAAFDASARKAGIRQRAADAEA